MDPDNSKSNGTYRFGFRTVGTILYRIIPRKKPLPGWKQSFTQGPHTDD